MLYMGGKRAWTRDCRLEEQTSTLYNSKWVEMPRQMDCMEPKDGIACSLYKLHTNLYTGSLPSFTPAAIWQLHNKQRQPHHLYPPNSSHKYAPSASQKIETFGNITGCNSKTERWKPRNFYRIYKCPSISWSYTLPVPLWSKGQWELDRCKTAGWLDLQAYIPWC
jgi:hypothetical protein